MMKYQKMEPINREEAESAFANGSRDDLCQTLVRVATFDPDRRWVQTQCVRFAGHRDAFVRGIAATCLGHLARIHKAIDEDEVMPVVRKLLQDRNAQTRAKAEDTIADFSIYLGWDKRKLKKLLAA